MNSIFDKALLLKNTLITIATNDQLESGDYSELRKFFYDHPVAKNLIPEYLKRNRTQQDFWTYIKAEISGYQNRRIFINESLQPLLDYCEKSDQIPSDEIISHRLENFAMDYVQEIWDKALSRRSSDPEGAITASRTLIETICKHILDKLEIKYNEKIDLPELYKITAKNLNLSPELHNEEIFKQILSGCVSIVNGIGSLRNRISDAHGKKINYIKPSERHATFVVNLSGTMGMFLIETYLNKLKIQ
ncbi:abortive infection family protein [Leptospira sp. 2 VSF19]|uniref:Abortive infection family protein n=1 Tax=Leptospira soteropolitanensis TaxID=2950025 RepID=A0AAW5VLA4_9LEPT|nr:abortive infection family protein [Leptospira soteropolitanensis]MCW7494742.1 abortive infection family protein [Leptospira soteropolitanensis]MCW7502344.1 abortive infection family protein [Leptospira soteropolitanensis]MCW7524571.1 abortive infection family protein [Leptospira soteropolitanensis]MCW7528441.1 abortive infection family protein [Leptospira soteropolitanensis]MCW7532311.1 abortive infection family protein [Leptospira soteropolitanensis]